MRRNLMILLKRLLARPCGPQTAGGIINWWEGRRIHFNAILLAIIIVATIVSGATNGQGIRTRLWGAGVTFVISIFVVLLPANIWYTGGWIADLLIKKGLRLNVTGFGPWALGAEIVFSLLFMVFIYASMFDAFFAQ
jgi:hypothetical protein